MIDTSVSKIRLVAIESHDVRVMLRRRLRFLALPVEEGLDWEDSRG